MGLSSFNRAREAAKLKKEEEFAKLQLEEEKRIKEAANLQKEQLSQLKQNKTVKRK